jgi:hypothetical protein
MFEGVKRLLRNAAFTPPVKGKDREHITYAVVLHPKGLSRKSLGIKALDSRTRDLARRTFVTVEGRVLPCLSISEKHNGNGETSLFLEVQPGFYTFAEIDE